MRGGVPLPHAAYNRRLRFCALAGHILRGCPAAEESVATNRAVIKNSRLYFPDGDPIPNDGSGLKVSIPGWWLTGRALVRF